MTAGVLISPFVIHLCITLFSGMRLSEKMDLAHLEAWIDMQYSPGPGQPPLPARLMVGRHYLKYAFDESDESVVAGWLETRTGSTSAATSTCSMGCRCTRAAWCAGGSRWGIVWSPCWSTPARGGQEGLLKLRELERVNVDTTVQERAVAFPTDARLYQKMRVALMRAARETRKLKT